MAKGIIEYTCKPFRVMVSNLRDQSVHLSKWTIIGLVLTVLRTVMTVTMEQAVELGLEVLYRSEEGRNMRGKESVPKTGGSK